MAVLDTRETLDALRNGYRDLVNGDAAYIPRIDLYAPTGRDHDYYRWGSMTGYCRSEAGGVVASRIKSDVLEWPGGRTVEKYCVQPGTYSGIILLYSAANGEPLAIMQDGYLQHMRVGCSAGLGAEALASASARSIGVLGSGGMARTYLEAIAAVRPLERGKIFSPTPAHREAFAAEMSEKLGLQLEAVDSAEDAVRDADVVATATDSMQPTFQAAWVRPGAHVTCVSSREIARDILDRADVVVQLGISTVPAGANVQDMEWPAGSVASYFAGQPEERRRVPAGGRKEEHGDYPHLADVTTGRAAGRVSDDQVTLFVNSGTQGLQFASVAGRSYTLAKARGLGQHLPTDLFLQDIRD
jgi:ornithine cyclodeaminase/alanine dehydrogenase-like protein (mu-crystallin family)